MFWLSPPITPILCTSCAIAAGREKGIPATPKPPAAVVTPPNNNWVRIAPVFVCIRGVPAPWYKPVSATSAPPIAVMSFFAPNQSPIPKP